MTEITQEEINDLASLFDALHNPVAAKVIRMAGLCGTVHYAAHEYLKAHRIAAEERATKAVLDNLRGLPVCSWLSAALDCDTTCAAMKADVRQFFDALDSQS